MGFHITLCREMEGVIGGDLTLADLKLQSNSDKVATNNTFSLGLLV
jgi:hypothetical protein